MSINMLTSVMHSVLRQWVLNYRSCFLVAILHYTAGYVGATHISNGISTRNSYNAYGKKPAAWNSPYIQRALASMEIINRTDEWPGVNAYYKGYVDRYSEYIKNETFVRRNSAPTGLNRFNFKYLGVCVNFQLLDSAMNNSYLGVYTCPLPFEPQQHTYCCGNDLVEYCCEPVESRISVIAGPLIVVPLALGVTICGIYSCFCARKQDAQGDEVAIDTKNSSQLTGVSYRATGEVSVNGSGNQTSTTSLGSDGDIGYESGPMAETRHGVSNPVMEGETLDEGLTKTEVV